MHSYNNAYAYRLISNIARAGLHMVTNPLDNAVLQGRFDTGPIRRGHTRVKQLQEAGVNVCIGHDSVMDPWYPLGYGDPLQAAFVLVHLGQMSGDAELRRLIEMITTNPASGSRRTRLWAAARRPGGPGRLRRADRRRTRCGWSRRARWCCAAARCVARADAGRSARSIWDGAEEEVDVPAAGDQAPSARVRRLDHAASRRLGRHGRCVRGCAASPRPSPRPEA